MEFLCFVRPLVSGRLIRVPIGASGKSCGEFANDVLDTPLAT